MRSKDVVDEHQIASLPRLTPGISFIDFVEQMYNILAKRITVAEAGIERQPIRAVDIHQVLTHLGIQRPLIEEGDLVEPAELTADRVTHNGTTALSGAQPPV